MAGNARLFLLRRINRPDAEQTAHQLLVKWAAVWDLIKEPFSDLSLCFSPRTVHRIVEPCR